MRIAIDATSLLDVRTGVGNFTAAVIERLAVRPDVDVTAFPVSLRGHHRLREAVPAGVDVATPAIPARLARRAWLTFGRPRIDGLIGRPEVVYGPNFVVPPSRAPTVVTVHDLTSVRFPELCTADTRQYPRLISHALSRGAWIHTVSDAVRDEVLAHFAADPERVVTVPNGFRPSGGGDPERGRRLAGLERFVLAVGTVEPRKDLPTLVRAVDVLAARGDDVPLVHVGPDGWGSDGLANALATIGRPDLVHRLGARSDNELTDLYAAATAFAYPSKYEGFGLPVLEAMSAGVPVVATDDPAIREVADDAASLVPVGDAEALATALGTLWKDEGLRDGLVRKGLDRADQFSWDRCVDGLVELFRRAHTEERSA